MKQLDIFAYIEEAPKPKRRVGRPNKITPTLVLSVVDNIKKKHKNITIIKNHGITERTFFRIKKGEYNHLLEKALEAEVDDFSLALNVE